MQYFSAYREYVQSISHPDGNGYFIVLPSEEPVVEVISWATEKIPDGTYIGIGRNLKGIVAIHIPKP